MKIMDPQTGEIREVWAGITWVSPTRAEWPCPACGKAMGLDFDEGEFEDAIPEGDEYGLYLYCEECKPKVRKFVDYAKKLEDGVRKYRLDRYDGLIPPETTCPSCGRPVPAEEDKPAIDCRKEVGELRDQLIIQGHGLETGCPPETPGMEVTETGRILDGLRSLIDSYTFKSTDLKAFVEMLREIPHVKSAEASEDGTVTAVVETPVEILTVKVPGWRFRAQNTDPSKWEQDVSCGCGWEDTVTSPKIAAGVLCIDCPKCGKSIRLKNYEEYHQFIRDMNDKVAQDLAGAYGVTIQEHTPEELAGGILKVEIQMPNPFEEAQQKGPQDAEGKAELSQAVKVMDYPPSEYTAKKVRAATGAAAGEAEERASVQSIAQQEDKRILDEIRKAVVAGREIECECGWKGERVRFTWDKDNWRPTGRVICPKCGADLTEKWKLAMERKDGMDEG